jgi:hypothetical protein
MTTQVLPVQAATETSITIGKHNLILTRIVWVAIMVMTFTVFVAGLIGFYDTYTPPPSYIADYFESIGLPAQIFPIVLITAEAAAIIVFWIMAIAIFTRRSDNAIVFAVSITLITSSVSVFSQVTWNHLLTSHNFLTVLADMTRFIGNAFILLMIYTLPDGRFVPRWTVIPFVLSIVYLVAFFASVQFWSLPFNVITRMIVFLVPILMLQPYRYRNISTPTQRQQTKWVVLAIIFAAVAFFIYEIIPLIFPSLLNGETASIPYRIFFYPLRQIALMALPIGLGIAVMRFRLWDVDLTINRSLVYGTITIGLFLLFIVNFFIFQRVFAALLPGSQDVIAAGIAGAINFAAYNPVRRRVRTLIDRRFYGFRFDLDQLKAAHRDSEQIKNRGHYTGQVIEGYELRGIIGRGGMGEVYEAVAGDEIVAIKTLPMMLAKEAEYQQRFEREGRATVALNHPNVVKVRSRGQTDFTSYLILEYIPGADLKSLIQQHGALALADTLDILRRIANALDYAHAQHIIHRDLKPSNVMLPMNADGETYHPILMDFGLARFTDASTTLTGSGAIGTIDYMSPEQILEARTVDHRADIYALGMLAFEMLAGKRPFEGSPGHVMFAHIQQPPPDIRDINQNVPEYVAQAIKKALSKNADDRFDSAGEFVSALSM